MNRASRTTRQRRSAFTLIEVVLAALITAIILIGAQSAIVIASKAVPDGKGKAPQTIRAAGVLEDFSADLCGAVSVDELTPSAIQVVVPDRNGDGKMETIRYEMTGKTAFDLTRTVNGVATTAAANIGGFALDYVIRDVASPTSYVEGPEVQVFSYTSALNLGSYAVTSSDWIGEAFTPTLPNGTVSWRLTRVQLSARVHGLGTGESRVQLWSAGGGLPVGMLAETPMYESAMGAAFSPQMLALDQPGLAPGSPVAVVVKWIGGLYACDIQYQSLLGICPGATLVTTGNGGSSWTAPLAQQMPLTVWGKPVTTGATTYTHYLQVVRCTLTVGDGGGVRSDVSVRILNEPQLTDAQAADALSVKAVGAGAAVGGK